MSDTPTEEDYARMQENRHGGTRVDQFDTFLRDYYRDDLGRLASRYPKDQQSLTISFPDLQRFDPAIADDLLNHPDTIIPELEVAVNRYDFPVDIGGEEGPDVRVRVADLPETYSVGAYHSDHVGSYISVEGQVTKTTDDKPRLTEAVFECQRCGTANRISQAATSFQEPHECDGCERSGPFQVNFDKSEFVDYQLVRVQQPPEETNGADGSVVDVHVEGNLVNTVQPGDSATLSGALRLQRSKQSDDEAPVFDYYVEGRDTEVKETDYDQINIQQYKDEIQELAARDDSFELLVDSLAPRITGERQRLFREAVVLQLFGGVRSQSPDGTWERGDIHLLQLGDPGTGKTRILRAASNIAPRSTFAEGKGASEAGMTAAAVRDDFGGQEWTLEAGALVLADKGLCAVDEIDKVPEDVVSTMHGALESPQTIEIHKAGINATLSSRTSLLAAGNPKFGRFDPYEPVGQQFDLDAPLLSRFDLIFTVKDEPEREKDRTIAHTMVKGRQTTHEYHHGGEVSEEHLADIEPEIDEEMFRAWIAYARQEITPTIPEPLWDRLETAYVTFRNEVNTSDEDGDTPIPLTARKLEAFQRLAEASARSRLSNTVEEEDIDRAMRLARKSMEQVEKDPDTGQYDADIVATGNSKSQRQRKKAVADVIQDMMEENSTSRVLVDNVLDKLEEEGYSRGDCKHDINDYAEKGELVKYNGEAGNKVQWM